MAAHLLGRRDHFGGAGDHYQAVLVRARAVEYDNFARWVFRAHDDLCGQCVARPDQVVEVKVMAAVDRAGPGQPGAEHGGKQRSAQHAVRNQPVQHGRVRVLLVDMRRVHIPRNAGKQFNVGLGQRSHKLGSITDRELVERAVLDHIESGTVVGGHVERGYANAGPVERAHVGRPDVAVLHVGVNAQQVFQDIHAGCPRECLWERSSGSATRREKGAAGRVARCSLRHRSRLAHIATIARRAVRRAVHVSQRGARGRGLRHGRDYV